MREPDVRGAVEFAYELGVMKRMPRAGMVIAGVPSPESVAAHSFRVAVLAAIIAVREGASPDRAAVLGLLHDVPETRTGDVALVCKPYVTHASPQAVIADQTARMTPPEAAYICGAITEHEEAGSPESKCSRDADRLDLILEARECQAAGNTHMSRFIESAMRVPFATEAGRLLAEAALTMTSDAWWEAAATRRP